jgi:hypothetical protein
LQGKSTKQSPLGTPQTASPDHQKNASLEKTDAWTFTRQSYAHQKYICVLSRGFGVTSWIFNRVDNTSDPTSCNKIRKNKTMYIFAQPEQIEMF